MLRLAGLPDPDRRECLVLGARVQRQCRPCARADVQRARDEQGAQRAASKQTRMRRPRASP